MLQGLDSGIGFAPSTQMAIDAIGGRFYILIGLGTERRACFEDTFSLLSTTRGRSGAMLLT